MPPSVQYQTSARVCVDLNFKALTVTAGSFEPCTCKGLNRMILILSDTAANTDTHTATWQLSRNHVWILAAASLVAPMWLP